MSLDYSSCGSKEHALGTGAWGSTWKGSGVLGNT